MEDLMEDIKCIVCFRIYDENIIPKIIPCGHTFCCECIQRLEDDDQFCPKCRSSLILHNSVVNYTVASMASALNQVSNNTRKEEEKLLQELRLIRNQMVIKKQNSRKYLDHISKNLETIEKHLSDINFVLELQPLALSVDKNFIENKKTILGQINEFTPKNFEPKLFATYNADEDPTSFLMKIYKRIEEGKTLLSFHQSNIDSGFVFGKITVWSNRIHFHSLSMVSPENCDEFIKFDDLKKVSSKLPLRLFFKIPCRNSINQMIMIRTLKSPLVLQFIKLCTGETGFCYAGASLVNCKKVVNCGKVDNNNYWSTSILKLTHYKSVHDKSLDVIGNLDYVLEGTKKGSNFFEPKTVIVGSDDGSFEVITSNLKSYSTSNIGIAIIESPANLKDIICVGESKILDSGIAFYIGN